MTTNSTMDIPAHVPQDRVVDFDYLRPTGIDEDLHLAWKRAQDSLPDIFWTPRNGGHWVATRAQDIKAIQLDHQRFSHKRLLIQGPEGHEGSVLTMDPPRHGLYRMLISPAFSPKAIAALEPIVRQTAVTLIEELRPRGECEFVGDFAKVLPVEVFLGLVDLPLEDREFLLPFAEKIARPRNPQDYGEGQAGLTQYISQVLTARAQQPGGDLLSKIVTAKIDGEPIAFEAAVALSRTVLAGGLDTVASILGFVARFLALNPGHRRQLIDDPSLVGNAVEELIRRHGIANTARVLTQDTEFKGVRLRAGEQILIPNNLYGLDERQVDDPLVVDFTRAHPDRHSAAFGNGPHRCPGSFLAKSEITVFLQEWLARIPDFDIKPGTTPRMASGHVNATHELHLAWDTDSR
ncbi:cytochrome [Saccharothrix sp. ALI-22-I]|uniref:cytochrome P450 n=1 Tax=Saccharothrix sp. ALI-22-I TaxID=1933778 RepID=UPI00097BC66A|nr:cytochrome P450 [Saccharothrix sp. ALI-22-I]ONI93057.1 cytochrome [Saccharothrix sp. ALI-22-I]